MSAESDQQVLRGDGVAPLQWGRTLMSAESSDRAAQGIRFEGASMGPHSDECGIPTIDR